MHIHVHTCIDHTFLFDKTGLIKSGKKMCWGGSRFFFVFFQTLRKKFDIKTIKIRFFFLIPSRIAPKAVLFDRAALVLSGEPNIQVQKGFSRRKTSNIFWKNRIFENRSLSKCKIEVYKFSRVKFCFDKNHFLTLFGTFGGLLGKK